MPALIPHFLDAVTSDATALGTNLRSNNIGRPMGRPRGSDFFHKHPHVAQAVFSFVAQYPHSAATVLDLLHADGIKPLPLIRVLQRFIRALEADRRMQLMRHRDPDAYRSKHMLALGSMAATADYAHQIWELDTTKADVKSETGRIMILAVIDRYSRRTRCIVAPSESGQSVRTLLLRAISDWGVIPETIVVDNGSGYVNRTVKTACDMLGIEHRPCPPGSPERKPFVERFFGTFMRSRAPMLSGFTGHNVAQAQQIRGRNKKAMGRAEILGATPPEEIQAVLDNWVSGTYEQRIHTGLGMAPMAKAAHSPRPARPVRDIMAVRLALTAFVGNLTVGKRGLVWKKGRYWCSELAAQLGRIVHVRRDEAELGALLVFDADGNFIGTAVNYERAGITEQQFAMAARAHVRSIEKIGAEEIRAAKRNFPPERAVVALLRQEAEAAGKLVDLATARDGAKARSSIARELTDSAMAGGTGIPATPQKSKPTSLPAPVDDIAARVARADGILADVAAGFDRSADDVRWAHAFVGGAAYLAHQASAAFARGEKTIIHINTRRTP